MFSSDTYHYKNTGRFVHGKSFIGKKVNIKGKKPEFSGFLSIKLLANLTSERIDYPLADIDRMVTNLLEILGDH